MFLSERTGTRSSPAAPSPVARRSRHGGGHRADVPLARPWSAAAVTAFAGAEILLLPAVQLPVMLVQGTVGYMPLLTGLAMVAAAVRLLMRPASSTVTGGLVLLVSLLSWFTANLGGLLLGMAAGLVGGCLAVAWRPPASKGTS